MWRFWRRPNLFPTEYLFHAGPAISPIAHNIQIARKRSARHMASFIGPSPGGGWPAARIMRLADS